MLPVIIIVSCGVLAVQPELRLAVPLLVGVTAVMVILLALALYRGERGELSWAPSTILGVALLLRLMFLLAPPQLSDDIYRYLWDGSTLLRGANPYAVAPSAVTPPSGLASTHALINHPDYVTIYPPAAQVVFAAGATMGGGITGLKAFLVLLDIGLCALVIAVLRCLNLPVWQAVLYAWNPLPVLEIAGSGHVDGAGLTMLLVSCWLLMAGMARSVPLKTWPFVLSGVFMAAASLVKLFPLALFPVLFLLVPSERRLYFMTGFMAGVAALLLPFLPHLTNMATTLDAYARNWEFAGFAFTTVRWLTGSGTVARLLLSTCFLTAAVAITLRLKKQLMTEVSPAAKGRLVLTACHGMAMAMLLLTPTLQPWYALCLAVMLPFAPGPAGLVLCWAVFLTYRVQILYFLSGQWNEDPYVTAAVFLAPVTAYVLSRVIKGTRTAPV